MNTLPRATRRLVRLLSNLSVILLFAALIPSCAKDGLAVSPVTVALPIANQTPMIIPPIHPILPQEPVQAFITTYNVPLTSNDEALGLALAAGLGYGDNAEIGFAFRSSVAGSIIGLGTLLPSTHFSHTVTLWDSATQVKLATIAVPNNSTTVFTYAAFAAAVSIQANHAYIVGFNSLAIGNTMLNENSPGNWFYSPQGLFVDGGLGSDLPLLPFREGNITVENAFAYDYGTIRVPVNLFPPASSWNGQPNGFFGLCDIEFAVPI
jgi:hypothetical protein